MQMRKWLSMWHGKKVLENRLFLYIAYLVGDGTHEEGDDKLQPHAQHDRRIQTRYNGASCCSRLTVYQERLRHKWRGRYSDGTP
jgi:hypothetical protein